MSEYAESHGRTEAVEALHEVAGTMAETTGRIHAEQTVGRALHWINQPGLIERWHRQLYYGLLQLAGAEEQPGALLNARYYERNARIFAKLTRVAGSGDRVLVVFGAGHSYWLRHFVTEAPGFELVEPNDYLSALGTDSMPAGGSGDDLFIEDLHAGSNEDYNFGMDPIEDSEGSEINLFSNNFADLAHLCADDPNCTADLSDGDNTSIDPQFVNLSECRLDPASPVATAVGFPNAPGMPSTDFDGNPIDPDSPLLGAVGVGSGGGPAAISVPLFSGAGLALLFLLVLLTGGLFWRQRGM